MDQTVQNQATPTSRARIPAVLVLFILLIAAGSYALFSWILPDQGTEASQYLSAQALEEQYGIKVWLVGVTAAGGLVDVRIKVLDAAKAEALLKDPANLPQLVVAGGDTTLAVPQAEAGDLRLEDDSMLFFLLPNTGGAVRPGTAVIVKFGEVELEPLPAQ